MGAEWRPAGHRLAAGTPAALPLTGQVAVVTGAARGIASHLSSLGASAAREPMLPAGSGSPQPARTWPASSSSCAPTPPSGVGQQPGHRGQRRVRVFDEVTALWATRYSQLSARCRASRSVSA